LACFGEFTESACRGGGKQAAAPIAWIVDAGRAQSAHGIDQGEAQRQGERRIEPDDHQRLTQILTRAALCVKSGVGDTQNFCRHRGIAPNGLRDLGHFDVGIARKGDDVRGDFRRTRKVDLRLEANF
jgi:hypothetical protein